MRITYRSDGENNNVRVVKTMGAKDIPDINRLKAKDPDKKDVDDSMEDADEAEVDSDVFEMDADAPTVIMQKAIDPSIFTTQKKADPEETRIIRAINPNGSKQMSEDELNRIVDEVGRFGAVPMDRLPSEVGKKDSKAGKKKKD